MDSSSFIFIYLHKSSNMRQQFGKDIHCDLIFVHASFYMYRLRFATVAKKYLIW